MRSPRLIPLTTYREYPPDEMRRRAAEIRPVAVVGDPVLKRRIREAAEREEPAGGLA